MKIIHHGQTSPRTTAATDSSAKMENTLFGWFAENSTMPIALMDRRGNFIQINEQLTHLLRQTGKNIKGTALSQFIDYSHRRKFAQSLDQVLREGQSQCELLLNLGEAHTLNVCLQMKFNKNSADTNIYLLIHPDLTENKNESVQRLQTKMNTMREMAGAITHKFNNQLMAISGNLQLLDEELPGHTPGRDLLEEARESARNAAKLAAQMLLYLGKGKLHQETISLVELIDSMRTSLEQLVKPPGTINFQLDENTPPVFGNLRQIKQLLENLVSNANEALNNEPGSITVRLSKKDCDYNYLHHIYLKEYVPSGQYVFLEISDTGCGIDSRILPRILDPFFTTKYPGRGLGLAIVLGIIQLHNGTIDVQSEPNSGTTIRVLLPAFSSAP